MSANGGQGTGDHQNTLNVSSLFNAWLKYQQAHLDSFIHRSKENLVNRTLKIGLGDETFLSFLDRTNPSLQQKRIENLKKVSQHHPYSIVFTFRTLHFIDWFVPIHHALDRLYPGKYSIIYLDYATTLRRILSGFEYLRYREQVHSRLLSFGIDPINHYSHEELRSYDFQPNWVVGLTSESIRQENLSIPIRIYLPHYSLPKAVDKDLPENINFEHVFLPTQERYSYPNLRLNEQQNKIEIHPVGYPKEGLKVSQIKSFPNSNKPLIVYAPSLDIGLLKKAIKEGIINVFKNNPQWNFLVKLHPSLESRRHYISGFFRNQLSENQHIVFDSLSNINSFFDEATVLICDFGSVGGEFSLQTGKRMIYLKVSKKYEGGGDLNFRDDYADTVSSIQELPKNINKVLKLAPKKPIEIEQIRKKVLTCSSNSDEKAATTIDALISKHQKLIS